MMQRYIAAKFRNPTGLVGRLVGNMMVRGNQVEQEWTVSRLGIQPTDHVLEIGYGPGDALQYAVQKARHVSGIDFSETMRQVARKRNAAAIRAGQVELKQGEVLSMPYADASFDKIYTIHCFYFWAKPLDVLREIQRVLKPGGLLAVTINPKDRWPRKPLPPPDLFTLYSADEVAQLLSDAGFNEVRVETHARPDKFPGACILGTKSGRV
ncbi:MAG TPA: methyltransferase domain-containing protein [Armatimonadota bacterium]|jgi:ubiquinone/menaquinone biosynthesis C-methylase UbiE